MEAKLGIVEKHIGMSLALHEKREMANYMNDKIRNKRVKDKDKQSQSPRKYRQVRSEKISMAAFAPDMVQWTQRDIKKIMNIDKKAED